MGGNRKHGFMRGNASGRTYDHRFRKFFCNGCQKEHGRRVERWQMTDGAMLCNRQYNARLDREMRERSKSA